MIPLAHLNLVLGFGLHKTNIHIYIGRWASSQGFGIWGWLRGFTFIIEVDVWFRVGQNPHSMWWCLFVPNNFVVLNSSPFLLCRVLLGYHILKPMRRWGKLQDPFKWQNEAQLWLMYCTKLGIVYTHRFLANKFHSICLDINVCVGLCKYPSMTI